MEERHPRNVPALGRPLSTFEAWVLGRAMNCKDPNGWAVPHPDRPFGTGFHWLCHHLRRKGLVITHAHLANLTRMKADKHYFKLTRTGAEAYVRQMYG